MSAPKPGAFEHANKIRHEWRTALAAKERGVLDAIHQQGKDGDYIRKITLISILSRVEGWSKDTARNALSQSGFALNLRLSDLEKSRQRIEDFELLLDSSGQQWSSHVTFPEGYPFFGKIDDVLAQQEVADFMVGNAVGDEEDEEETQSIEQQTESLLDDLLDDEDDEEDEESQKDSEEGINPNEMNDLLDDLL